MVRASVEGGGRARAWVAAETLALTGIALAISTWLDTGLPWLVLPLGVLAVRAEKPEAYGLDLRFRPPGLGFHLTFGVFLLAAYAAMHAAFAIGGQHRSFAPHFSARPLLELVPEILAVAVPEEVFFRGYLQARWDLALGTPWSLFGASVGPGLLVQAAVFAACHLVGGDWTRLRVFFFALIAGWLRSRSGSVLAPVAYHGVTNVWYRLVDGSFR